MSLMGNTRDEIFIIDDDAEIRDSLSLIFTREGYRVTTFRDAATFIAAARIRTPGCVLLDVHMPGKSGLDILKELDARNYTAPILMMSGRGDIPTAVVAIKEGACGFVEKGMNGDTILARVRESINDWAPQPQRNGNGGSPAPPSFPGYDKLTPRELEVLSQIAAAASNKEAANNLGISQRTVEVHRIHIMQKLEAKNAVDLMRIVMSNGRVVSSRPRNVF